MKIRDRLIEEIKIANGLRNEENTEQLVNAIISIVRNEENPRDQLRFALGRYLECDGTIRRDPEETERIFAGVLAFIWVNLWDQPYQPLYMYPVEDEPKKWWQFWKKDN